MFLKRFSSFLGFFESLISVDQQQPLLLTGEFSIQCNTTNLTKRSHFFHPSPIDSNFLELRSTNFSIQTEFFCLPFHVPFTFWTWLPCALSTTCACHVFNLLCNRRFDQSVLLFSVFDATCADLPKFSSP